MDGMADAMQVLRRARRPVATPPDFTPIEPTGSGPVAAVDGSHAVLVDNGPVWIVATRAMAIDWPGAVLPATPRIHATLAGDAAAHLDAAYAAHGLDAPRATNAEAYAAALRDLEEMAAAREAARRLPDDGLLLIDGALTGLPPGPQALADRIVEAARGRLVAGVSKRSARSSDGVPLVPAVTRAGRDALPGQAWHADTGDGHVALLHPRARHGFRIDAIGDVWGRLAGLSDDAVYLGYPYPLAKVHNAVAITAHQQHALRERILREAGPDAEVLADFHHVLDRNVAR